MGISLLKSSRSWVQAPVGSKQKFVFSASPLSTQQYQANECLCTKRMNAYEPSEWMFMYKANECLCTKRMNAYVPSEWMFMYQANECLCTKRMYTFIRLVHKHSFAWYINIHSLGS
jgi:hypothetical protein